MTKHWLILLASLALTACSSVQIAPLDDAYYYPDSETAAATETQANSQRLTANSQTQPASSVEYVNVQDTTVTIRVKR